MDSLIAAAGRALAAGDALGALNFIALRDDAPALALRGVAMARLGDLARAKGLLKRAARAFGPREAVARARCAIAEAEIALVSRDLGRRRRRSKRARHARAARRPRQRRACALPREPLPAADRPARRGRKPAGRFRSRAAAAASRVGHELVVAGLAMRRLRIAAAAAALTRAERAARQAGVPALVAEVESLARALDAPAARLIARGQARLVGSARWRRCSPPRRWSSTPAVMSCVAPARRLRWRPARSCSRWPMRSPKPGRRRVARRAAEARLPRQTRRRVASRAAARRDRPPAQASCRRRRHRGDQ